MHWFVYLDVLIDNEVFHFVRVIRNIQFCPKEGTKIETFLGETMIEKAVYYIEAGEWLVFLKEITIKNAKKDNISKGSIHWGWSLDDVSKIG